jgi:hypothetical protein
MNPRETVKSAACSLIKGHSHFILSTCGSWLVFHETGSRGTSRYKSALTFADIRQQPEKSEQRCGRLRPVLRAQSCKFTNTACLEDAVARLLKHNWL